MPSQVLVPRGAGKRGEEGLIGRNLVSVSIEIVNNSGSFLEVGGGLAREDPDSSNLISYLAEEPMRTVSLTLNLRVLPDAREHPKV